MLCQAELHHATQNATGESPSPPPIGSMMYGSLGAAVTAALSVSQCQQQATTPRAGSLRRARQVQTHRQVPHVCYLESHQQPRVVS